MSKISKSPAPSVCPVCGKKTASGIMGNLCAHRMQIGETPKVIREITQKASLPTPPKGWVKLAQVSRACESHDIPVSRFVKAFGGDTIRGVPQTFPAFVPVIYVGKVRYVPGFFLTEKGLTAIKNLVAPKTAQVSPVSKDRLDEIAKEVMAEAS